jgi:hypothetical protein
MSTQEKSTGTLRLPALENRLFRWARFAAFSIITLAVRVTKMPLSTNRQVPEHPHQVWPQRL